MSEKVQATSKFSDIEGQVGFMKGNVQYLNSIADMRGEPRIDPVPAERAIRKQHAKFYGTDSKYDGKGRLRVQAYDGLPESKRHVPGRKLSLKEVIYGVDP